MKRFHIAINVADLERSIFDYSNRLGCKPETIVGGEYALWRTDTLNFSIRVAEPYGSLRHVGWEEDTADAFQIDADVNGIDWEHFSHELQLMEIENIWPSRKSPFSA